MKRIACAIFLLTVLVMAASAQVAENVARVPVSGLPSAAMGKHKGYVVTDASNTSDCAVGGGTTIIRCWSDGTNWISGTADYVPKTTQVAGASLNGDINASTIKTALVLIKGDVGLGNVDNTSDASKPVSSATTTALNLKADLAGPTFTGTPTVPTGTIASGSFLFTAIAAPATPASGKGSFYIDSTSKNLAVKDDAGIVKHGVQTKTSVSNSFATAIADDGTVTVAQPTFANLASTPTTVAGYGITDAVATSRSISTTSPLAGGGDLSANRTFTCTTCATTTNGGALSGTSPVAVSAGGAISCTTCLVSSTPVTIAQGGTGTASTLTGLVRGSASAMTAAELSGDVTTSGSNAVTIASSAVTRGKSDSTVLGIGVVSTSSVNGVAATDTQLLQLTLPAGYLNISNGLVDVMASGIWTTGTTQTPTQNFKIKLCTVSGCGSGTVLTLLTMTSAAATASTTQTFVVTGTVGTVSTGSSGTVVAHGIADLPVGASANVAFAGFHDVNTAASSGIDLTAQLFLNLMWNVSTQSGTKNSAIGHILSLKPRD